MNTNTHNGIIKLLYKNIDNIIIYYYTFDYHLEIKLGPLY